MIEAQEERRMNQAETMGGDAKIATLMPWCLSASGVG